jgi:septal ring factor EnvC (AmiA/AmiB activator)
MAHTHRNLGRRITLAVVFPALLSCALVTGVAAETSPSLSKNELKTLRANAKTPADHQRLAIYYRDKAQRLTAQAQEFSAQADRFATQPATIESKQGISCNCARHYRYFAELYAQQAKEYETLAEKHAKLSQAAPANGEQK